MVDDKKDDDKRPSKLGAWFGKVLDDAYGGLKEAGELGLIGTLIYLFAKDKKGMNVVKEAFQLGKKGLDFTGTELEPIVAHIKGWTIEELRRFENAVKFALGTLIITGAVVVIGTGFIHPMLWRGLAALGSSFLVIYTLHAQFVRAWPLLMAIGLVVGVSEEGSKFKLSGEMIKSFPGMLIGGLRHGGREGLGWIGQVWRYIALVCVWFTAGDIYITITNLWKAPELIFLGLMTVPILTFIPLALPYKDGRDRGPQFNALMYICGFILLDIFVWCNLYDYIQIVLHYPNSWIKAGGNISITLISLWELGVSIFLAVSSQRRQELKLQQGSGKVYSSGGVIYEKAPQKPGRNGLWIMSLIAIVFIGLVVGWIATNGTLPGGPNGPKTFTPHQRQVILRQEQEAKQQADEMRRQQSQTESTSAGH